MGAQIQKETFEEEDYARFAARLTECLEALRLLLARPGFGEGPATVGAELELNVIDAAGRPLPRNRDILATTDDHRVTVEMDRFNLEINGKPRPLAGRPFSTMSHDLADALRVVKAAAAEHGGRIAVMGILPTLAEADLWPQAMTDAPRYRALSAGIRRLRKEPFAFRIDGEDALDVTASDVTFEGASTSFQLHLRVSPSDFARTHNAVQIATAPVLAAAVNSPLFLGHRLWDETRIALFRQATDDRAAHVPGDEWRPARVSFGHGWVRRSAWELFAESVALHAPLLPVCGAESPLEVAREGGVPALTELRLHGSTVWRWNRAIFDPTGGGHLRVEMRPLPAGPTFADMAANAAFFIGLTLGLAPIADELVNSLTYGMARRNFYAAAQRGLDIDILWPCDDPPSPKPVPAKDLIVRLLPIARKGLLDNGVDAKEADQALSVIEARVAAGQTGADWQRRALASLERRRTRAEALPILLERYMQNAEDGAPVHQWKIPQ